MVLPPALEENELLGVAESASVTMTNEMIEMQEGETGQVTCANSRKIKRVSQ
jgi:hypothetical protein